MIRGQEGCLTGSLSFALHSATLSAGMGWGRGAASDPKRVDGSASCAGPRNRGKGSREEGLWLGGWRQRCLSTQ